VEVAVLRINPAAEAVFEGDDGMNGFVKSDGAASTGTEGVTACVIGRANGASTLDVKAEGACALATKPPVEAGAVGATGSVATACHDDGTGTSNTASPLGCRATRSTGASALVTALKPVTTGRAGAPAARLGCPTLRKTRPSSPRPPCISPLPVRTVSESRKDACRSWIAVNEGAATCAGLPLPDGGRVMRCQTA
jgi:hypothetical protein